MISFLYDYINSILIFFSLVFGLKYLIQHDRLLAIRILGLQLLCNFIFLVIALFVNPQDLMKYPFLIGYIKPMVYLFPAFTYLFHYYLLRPGKKFNYYFLILFLPYLLAMVENLPFFFSSNAVKLSELQLIFEKHDYFYRSPAFTWIPPLYHIYFKILFYTLAAVFLIRDFLKFIGNKFFLSKERHSIVLVWLVGIIIFRILTIIYTLYTFVFAYSPRINYSGLELLIVGDSVFSILFLLFNPSLLDVYYFRTYIHDLKENTQQVKDPKLEVETDFTSEYKKINASIEKYFATQNDYLLVEFTVEKLAQQTQLPQRIISFAIKQLYGISVKDYINKKRMEYLIHQYLIDEKVRSYSFDYLAEMAGFGSRQTLYSCSQKFYNCPPKELFESKFHTI